VTVAFPLKLIFPHFPWYLATIIAVTLGYAGYEQWHAILHLPAHKWEPLLYEHRYSRQIQHVYNFHWMHHGMKQYNMAVFGCWGIAIWDHIFRTHRRPSATPSRREGILATEVVKTDPRWPISMFDRWETAAQKTARKVERRILGN